MEELPQEIHKRITLFLKTHEALALSSSSKRMKTNIDMAVLHDTFSHTKDMTNLHKVGPYHDSERIWFRFMPLLLQDHIHTIQFVATWRDQGWGNRKSVLYIYEDKNEHNHQGKVVARSPTAEHHETTVKMQFQPKPGKNYTMCYCVGGGGGHELFVTNPRILTLVFGCSLITIAAQFQKNNLVPMLTTDTQFVTGMMRSCVELLMKSMDRGEEPDQGLSSCFTDIGLDVTKRDILESIKIFLTLCVEFQSRQSSSGPNVSMVPEELNSEGSDYQEPSGEESSESSSDEMDMDS